MIRMNVFIRGRRVVGGLSPGLNLLATPATLFGSRKLSNSKEDPGLFRALIKPRPTPMEIG